MTIYYVDYENVTSQGLKGVENLTENDEVNILYSKKADNIKIEILTLLMRSKAQINFLPVHVGTPNALDFQLITLLFLHYKKENRYFIISKDSGYDCCIKTGIECGADTIARCENIEISLAVPSSRGRRRRSKRRGNDSFLADGSTPSSWNNQESWVRDPGNGQEESGIRAEERLSGYPDKLVPPSVAAIASAYHQDENNAETGGNVQTASYDPSDRLEPDMAYYSDEIAGEAIEDIRQEDLAAEEDAIASYYKEDSTAYSNSSMDSSATVLDSFSGEELSSTESSYRDDPAPDRIQAFGMTSDSSHVSGTTPDGSYISGTAAGGSHMSNTAADGSYMSNTAPDGMHTSDMKAGLPGQDQNAAGQDSPLSMPEDAKAESYSKTVPLGNAEDNSSGFPQEKTDDLSADADPLEGFAMPEPTEYVPSEGRTGRRSRRSRQGKQARGEQRTDKTQDNLNSTDTANAASSESDSSSPAKTGKNASGNRTKADPKTSAGSAKADSKASAGSTRADSKASANNTKSDSKASAGSAKADSKASAGSARSDAKLSPAPERSGQKNGRADNSSSDKAKQSSRQKGESASVLADVIRKKNDVNLSADQLAMIADSLRSTGNKQQFYNYFVKQMGQKGGLELYHSIKSSYGDMIAAGLNKG